MLPRIGAPLNVRSPRLQSLRRWPVPNFPNHLIFYRPTAEGIEIIRVLHGARDVTAILGEDEHLQSS